MGLIDCEIKLCRNASRLVEPSMFQILEPAALFFFFDLQHSEYCLIIPIDLGIYI